MSGRITIAPGEKVTLMLHKVTFDEKGIHGIPCDSGMGIAPGEGRKLPMELVYDGEGYVSAPSFCPSGIRIRGALVVLVEAGVVSASYTNR